MTPKEKADWQRREAEREIQTQVLIALGAVAVFALAAWTVGLVLG